MNKDKTENSTQKERYRVWSYSESRQEKMEAMKTHLIRWAALGHLADNLGI